MKAIHCSPENAAYLLREIPKSSGIGALDGTQIRENAFIPTWKTYPRPKWWRRWFLREKQKPPERVYWIMDEDAFKMNWSPQVQVLP